MHGSVAIYERNLTSTWPLICWPPRFGYEVWHMGRGGSLVDSSPFVRRVVGSNPALAAAWGPWKSTSLSVACGASGVKLRYSIRAASGAPLSSSGMAEARYRKSLNELIN